MNMNEVIAFSSPASNRNVSPPPFFFFYKGPPCFVSIVDTFLCQNQTEMFAKCCAGEMRGYRAVTTNKHPDAI